jgi:CHAD domain-containing protein
MRITRFSPYTRTVAQMTKTGVIERQIIRFQTTRDLRSGLRIPTPTSVHAVRRALRRTLARLGALRPVLGHTSFGGLRKSLRKLVDITAESRDAEVQRRIISALKADIPKGEAREYDRVLMKFRSRQRAANVELAEYLCSNVGAEQLRRINEDLSALRVAQSGTDLTRLACRRYRGALHDIEKLRAHKIATGRRVHPLRIKMRRACDLVCLLQAREDVCAAPFIHKLNKMQDALGDLHDAMLIERWLHERGLTLTPSLSLALDALAERSLKRCKRYRKPLRHAIRQFLAKARQ